MHPHCKCKVERQRFEEAYAGEEKATAAMAEEAQTVEAIVVSAILCLQELVMKNEQVCVEERGVC